MLPTLVASLVLLQPAPISLYTEAPYRAGVPRPESILGYELGTRQTVFRDQERVLQAIAARSTARMRVFDYGRSVEGRPLRVIALGSERNIGRLDELRKAWQTLGNPTDEALAKRLAAETPALVWINQTIHGNEPASFESCMALVYNLAASESPRVRKMLDNAVVLVNPVYNPDGHERFAVYSNSVSIGSSEPAAFEQIEPSIIHGRTNHYRFDMNRDRVSFSQDETRQEVREFLSWKPQVYVDQHGQTDNYFFPPNPMSVNANVDRARVNGWTDVFGRATGKAFDAKGWTYFVKDTYDLYFAGYLDTFATLSGAIGMTHETDGGKQLAKRRNDDSVLTLRDGLEKHFVSAMAVIEASAANRTRLVGSYLDFKRKAVTGEHAGKFQRVVVASEDPRPLIRLQTHLSRAGIRSAFATADFKQADANDYWSGARGEVAFPRGSLVIDMAQSQGPLAKALLEPQSDFEPEFVQAQKNKDKTAPKGETYPGPEGSEFYDLTGWALPYNYHLKAWWCESAPTVATVAALPAPAIAEVPTSTVGYAIRFRDVADGLAAFDALRGGVRGLTNPRPLKIGGDTFDRGTFFFLAARNNEGYEQILRQAVAARGSRLVALPTSYPEGERWGPGSENMIALRRPEVAVAFNSPTQPASFGHVWYLLERTWKIPFTPLANLNRLDRYSALLVPSGGGATVSATRPFAERGGAVIALGGFRWAVGSAGFVDLKTTEAENDLPGSLFRAEMDPRSFLSYGYPSPAPGASIEIAVPVAGDSFYQVRSEGGSMIRLSSDEKVKKLLTGWAYDDTEKSVAGTVFAQQIPVGDGHVVLFMDDPADRALYPGLEKILLSAILFGPRF